VAKSNKSRKKKTVTPKFRRLTDLEMSFRDEYKKYSKVLSATTNISLNQHGIDTDGRGVRAVKIFTRQTLSGMSLNSLLPKLSTERDPDSELWDLCSIASLSRNILEAYLVVYYSGTESISDEEAELRFFIGQLHRNREWYRIHKKQNSDVKLLKEFEDGMKEQKLRIKEHPYLNSLTVPQKNKALKGDEMYYTKADFESKNEICNGLSLDFQLLSNFVHPLPLSIERIDNDRGRGESNIYDLTYSLACLKIATKYLAASTVSVVDNFPEELGKRFKLLIDPIREFQFDEGI
jgi:hypothetical protein